MSEKEVKIIVSVRTDMVGSEVYKEIIVDKEEWYDMCEAEREAHLKEEALKLFNWDWKIEE